MNKISKKIVALATMAAFVLTLVPAAAFGATDNPVDPTNSAIVLAEDQDDQVITGEKANLNLELKNSKDEAITEANVVYVWVEDAEGNVVSDVNYYDSHEAENPVTSGNNILWLDNGKVLKLNQGKDDRAIAVAVNVAGDYTVKAGVNATEDQAASMGNITPFADTVALTVVDAPATGVYFYQENGTEIHDTDGDLMFDLTFENENFNANGTDTYKLYGKVTADGIVEGKTVAVESGDAENLQFLDKTGTMETTADKDGKFTIEFTMNDNRNVPIYVTIDGEVYTVNVLKDDTSAYDIDVVKDGGYVLAGEEWATYGDASEFSDAVLFSVVDEAGNAVSIANEPATTVTNLDEHAKYVRIIDRAKGSDLTANEIVLTDLENGYATLEYVGSTPAKDLKEGKYEVRVALLKGDYADVTFNVSKFGEIVDLDLSMKSVDYNFSGRIVSLNDEVTLGQAVGVEATYVDENGIRVPAENVNGGANISIGATGKAVIDGSMGDALDVIQNILPEAYQLDYAFMTKLDNESNASLLGTTVQVTAFDATNGLQVIKDLTVVDSYNVFDLEFDPTEGAANQDNKVTVQVVKENGDVAQVDGDLQYYIEDISNEDAKVTVKNVKDVVDGEGSLTIYGTEDTVVTIAVAVVDDSNDGIYVGSLEYTIGDGDIVAHHNVTMTIGSSQYVVDKQLFEMDAAPYVDSNWRTMVPLRALMEGFDAEVIWDNDARTVTINYNEQTIVMTIDETTYTVNGEEMTMDTEPVIQGDRTYVPIRFAAEAMGFNVLPLYNADGLTSSVVFQS